MQIAVQVIFPHQPAQTAKGETFGKGCQPFQDLLLSGGEGWFPDGQAFGRPEPAVAFQVDPAGKDLTQDLSQGVDIIAGNPFVTGKVLPVEEGFGIGQVDDFLDRLIGRCLGRNFDDPAGQALPSERDENPLSHGHGRDEGPGDGIGEGFC